MEASRLEAIRARLIEDENQPKPADSAIGLTPRQAADELDRLRQQIGPIGISVSELIAEGRRL